MNTLKLLLLSIIPGICHTTTTGQDKSNIIFIFTDDLGWGDLGCYGLNRLHTPNIDKMASEGLRLTELYDISTLTGKMEEDNVASEHPEIVEEYIELLMNFKHSIPPGRYVPGAGRNEYSFPERIN